MFRKKNILIISNRGFIGKSLYEYFTNQKVHNIIGLNSETCDLLDINKTKKAISKVLVKPFTIVFLSTYGRFPEDNYSVYEKNTKMITNLLNSIENKFVEHFIFFSSTCLYGRPPKSIPISEALECVPNGYYGLSKYVSEKFLRLKLACPISIIRIPGVYGKFDNNKSIVSLFIKKIISDEKIILYDKGSVLRDYVFIKDIIEVTEYIIEKSTDILLNIATGKSLSLVNIISLLEGHVNKKAFIIDVDSGHEQFDMTFNIDYLKNFMPHFKPCFIEDGVREYIADKNILSNV